MNNPMQFLSRSAFREWLQHHASTSEGIWIKFEKGSHANTLKAQEALEEALCFGWIDGQMKRIDETCYIKYFSCRRKSSKWSLKNKKLVQQLEEQGLMDALGREKIKEAKANGQWEKASPPTAIAEDEIELVMEKLKVSPQAFQNFMNMSASVKKTYTRAYLAAKSEDGRQKRLAWMIARLEKNLKPM